jgi:O-Antigen ligase
MRKLLSFSVTCYLGLLLYFPNSSWGLTYGVNVFNLYGRGTGVLPLPIINITLYLLYIASAFFSYQQRNVYHYFNIRYFFWGFNALFLMFAFYGIATGETFKKISSSTGLINVVNMYLFMVILSKFVSTTEKLEKLSDFVIFCALTRGIWGLVRWAFLGGDPANIYANAQKIAIKLTFFDINDNLIATFGAFLAAWLLLYRKSQLSRSHKLFYYLMIGVGLAVVLLSYRRTAWGGLVAAGLWFVWQQPWRRRIQVGFIAALIGTMTLPILIGDRFSNSKGGRGGTGLFYDITSKKGKIETSEGRFSELDRAWDYISESPFTGVMPWGGIGYGGSHEFVHSGFLHLWLKGGVLALLFFVLILWGYFIFIRKVRREIAPENRGLTEAAFAGLLFSLPGLFFGTPFIEFRTTQLLGVLLIFPYIVYGLKKTEAKPKISPINLKHPMSAKP